MECGGLSSLRGAPRPLYVSERWRASSAALELEGRLGDLAVGGSRPWPWERGANRAKKKVGMGVRGSVPCVVMEGEGGRREERKAGIWEWGMMD